VWVISRKKLREFWEVHPDAKEPLRAWEAIAEQAEWQSFADVRKTFGKRVDKINGCYVFDIGGGKYRLIANLGEGWVRLFVRQILTHQEYDRNEWKKYCDW
jgi:mRNA interferase HigB